MGFLEGLLALAAIGLIIYLFLYVGYCIILLALLAIVAVLIVAVFVYPLQVFLFLLKGVVILA
ncbi:hypothetical protein, partial [Granulicatella balaenopterae]